MADIPTRQYNLRSGRQDEDHLPIQLQMAEDSTFLTDLLASQNASIFGQVSDDSSINDCEALVASSDDKQKSELSGTINKQSTSSLDPACSNIVSVSQQAINIQILEQLQVLQDKKETWEIKK